MSEPLYQRGYVDGGDDLADYKPLNVAALHDALVARGYHADEMDLDSLALEYAARAAQDVAGRVEFGGGGIKWDVRLPHKVGCLLYPAEHEGWCPIAAPTEEERQHE